MSCRPLVLFFHSRLCWNSEKNTSVLGHQGDKKTTWSKNDPKVMKWREMREKNVGFFSANVFTARVFPGPCVPDLRSWPMPSQALVFPSFAFPANAFPSPCVPGPCVPDPCVPSPLQARLKFEIFLSMRPQNHYRFRYPPSSSYLRCGGPVQDRAGAQS